MIAIGFKDYLIDKPTFDRLFEHTPTSPLQSRQFEALRDALADAFWEHQTLQNNFQKEENPEAKMKIASDIKALTDRFIKIKHQTVARKGLDKWLKLSITNYAVLTKHKVIGA